MLRTCFPLLLLLVACGTPVPEGAEPFASDYLEVKRLTDHTYVHTSFLQTGEYGRVPCNGLIVVEDGEAIVYDSPATDSAASELIYYVEKYLDARIRGVVATHFHADCLGGFPAFAARGIPTYASDSTAAFAAERGMPLPARTFSDRLELTAGKLGTVTVYPGPGHTRDNVVGYVPREEVLFGGCLIKSMGAAKGNLADADTARWAATVARVVEQFPRVRHVVPGHGAAGGAELLKYTEDLFTPK